MVLVLFGLGLRVVAPITENQIEYKMGHKIKSGIEPLVRVYSIRCKQRVSRNGDPWQPRQ